MKNILKIIRKYFVNIWFIVLFAVVLVYNILNWGICTDFSQITGNNILFVTLIVLSFAPLVNKIIISVGNNKFELDLRLTNTSNNSANRIKNEILGSNINDQ